MRNSRVMAIVAAIQPTAGVAVTPSPATGAVEASGISPKQQMGTDVTADTVNPYLGHNEIRRTGFFSVFNFSVELAGSGVKGTAPAFDLLLRACAWSKTVVPSESVTYSLVDSIELNTCEMLTIDVYLDGEKYRMIDARGTIKLSFSTDGLPKIDYEFTGVWQPVVYLNFSDITFNYSAFKDSVPFSKANTPTATFFGEDIAVADLNLDQGQNVNYRNRVNFEATVISDRKLSGSITFDAPELSDINFYDKLPSDTVTTGALELVHGTTEGNVVEIDVPKLQITDVEQSDDSGIMQYSIPFNLLPGNGNQEMTITFK